MFVYQWWYSGRAKYGFKRLGSGKFCYRYHLPKSRWHRRLGCLCAGMLTPCFGFNLNCKVFGPSPFDGALIIQESLMKKSLLFSLIFAVLIAGVGVLISGESIRFGNGFGSVRGINSRTLAIIALPFVFLLYLLVNYLRKRSEERKWKKAILDSQARKQKAE